MTQKLLIVEKGRLKFKENSKIGLGLFIGKKKKLRKTE